MGSVGDAPLTVDAGLDPVRIQGVSLTGTGCSGVVLSTAAPAIALVAVDVLLEPLDTTCGTVVGLDVLPRFVGAGGHERLRFVLGDVRSRAAVEQSFTTALLHDVLGDYPEAQRVGVFESLVDRKGSIA